MGADRHAPQRVMARPSRRRTTGDRAGAPDAVDVRDAGMVTAFVVVFSLALVFVTALVVDGGRMLAEHRHAGNLADSAARAGAQQVSEDAVRTDQDEVLDVVAAEAAACAFLVDAGHAGCDGTGTFATAQGNQVTVQITGTIDLLLLPGGPQPFTAEGTACIAVGIDASTTC